MSTSPLWADGGGQPQLRGRLLLVDDEPLLLRAFTRVLTRAGHDVTQAADGAAALALVSEHEYDGAFVDIGLPGAGGLEVMAALQRRDPELPVVLMTGAPSLQTAMDAVGTGALRYLCKPIDASALQQLAREVIEARRRGSESAAVDVAETRRFERALAELYMVYQPIVRPTQRELFAYEALVRTREPSVPHPGALLDLAQRCDRLPELGRAIRRLVASRGDETTARLFINLHTADLLDEDLYDPAAPLARLSARVVLEVIERAGLEGIADLGGRLERLRAIGYRVAIDDLGEGYSGLTSLARVGPEFVKLDMSLVRGLDRLPTQRHIVRSTVQLCRVLGAEVIAEGVETEAERDALLELGCELLQGYLFARPAPGFAEPSLP